MDILSVVSNYTCPHRLKWPFRQNTWGPTFMVEPSLAAWRLCPVNRHLPKLSHEWSSSGTEDHYLWWQNIAKSCKNIWLKMVLATISFLASLKPSHEYKAKNWWNPTNPYKNAAFLKRHNQALAAKAHIWRQRDGRNWSSPAVRQVDVVFHDVFFSALPETFGPTEAGKNNWIWSWCRVSCGKSSAQVAFNGGTNWKNWMVFVDQLPFWAANTATRSVLHVLQARIGVAHLQELEENHIPSP